MTLSQDPLIGTLINGRYEVLAEIGRGGMSQVYKAKNKTVGSIVAIKMLKTDYIADNEMVARFSRETAAARRLAHRNIVSIHETGIDERGNPYLVMDYLEGMPLSEIIEKEGRLPVKRCLKIFVQIANGLSHMHANNVIHRDIKPGNIMVTQTAAMEDYVKIFDFGFVKLLPTGGTHYQRLTQAGDILGTPLYMSPEQSLGRELDARSDIYSFGCVMYECLTGKAPLVGDNVAATMQKQIKDIPESLDVARPDLYIPEQLTQVIFKTLEKEPADRYQSSSDVRGDLEVISDALLRKKSAPVIKPAIAKLKKKSGSRRKWPISVIFLFLLTAAAAALTASMTLNSGNLPSIYQIQIAPEINKHRQAGLNAFKQGNYAQAQIQLQTALNTATSAKIREKETLLLQDLARVYLVQDKTSEATNAINRAISIQKDLLGSNSLLLTQSFEILALIQIASNNKRDAENTWLRILSMEENNRDISKSDLVHTVSSLAYMYEENGQQDKAEEYYKKAISYAQTQTDNNLLLSQAMHDYANFLKHLNRKEEARKVELKSRALK